MFKRCLLTMVCKHLFLCYYASTERDCMSKKKVLLSILFLAGVAGVTFYGSLSNTDLDLIVENLKRISPISIIMCCLLVLVYFYLQGLYMKYVLRSMDVDISLSRGTFYSIIEFFFSAITPSSSGGQPIQLLYMTKDKIPIRKSLIVLILNTIVFKLYLVVMGIVVVVFNFDYVAHANMMLKTLFFAGLVVDVAVIVFCYLLLFNQKLVRKILVFGNAIIAKLTKGKYDYSNKIDTTLEDYIHEAIYMRTHVKEVIISTIITFIQRTCMFAILYVIYKALGLKEYSFLNLLNIQILAMVSIEGLPLPGGVGALEEIQNTLYKGVFGKLATTAMVLNRTFSFYIPLIVVMIVIIVVSRRQYRNVLSNEKVED